ncbi:MAG: YbbR-like domain-containing protein [Desulfuromonadales bacterium]|nr:YbbR-like domain-containing protein [Desulfuromonadales bacterium]
MLEKLTENWILKLVSLTFAIVLWFFVMGERKLEVGFQVPLQLENIPVGLMVANEVPNLIDVRISGPRTVLMNLQPSDIRLAVDLKELQPGVTSFKRLEERLNIPSALKVTRLSPSFVDVKLERIRQKSVAVRPVFSGTPAPGYQLGAIQASPSTVSIEGAESELKDVPDVTTEPIEVEGVRESFTLMVPLQYPGRYSYLKNQQTAEVRVTIEPVTGADTAPALPVEAPLSSTPGRKQP